MFAHIYLNMPLPGHNELSWRGIMLWCVYWNKWYQWEINLILNSVNFADQHHEITLSLEFGV